MLPQPVLLAEHADFLVFHKPAGLGFHAEAGEPGFVELAREVAGDTRLFPVHRLDRITSGLILLARSSEAARMLGEAFADGRVEKYYLALSDRTPGRKQGLVKGAMCKGRSGSWRLGEAGGPLALTQFFSYGLGCLPGIERAVRLFVLRPRTGRTHQLRVALKSLGSPILGDARYAGAAADRGYLHAWQLRFDWQGQTRHYVCPPDAGAAFLSQPCQEKLVAIGDPASLPWPNVQRPRPDCGTDVASA